MHLIGILGSYANRILLPNQISAGSLITWLDGADPNNDSNAIPLTGTNIPIWYNKVSGSNATASSAGSFIARGGISFTGSQVYQFTPGSLATYTAFIVASPSSVQGAYVYTTTNGNNDLQANYNLTNPYALVNGPGASTYFFGGGSGPGFPTNLLSWTITPSSFSNYYMGRQNYGYSGSTEATIINTIGNNFSGIIYEIILYSTVLSKLDRQNVEGYLATKWNMQTLLIRSHPYFIPT
jgi:hypothetical protein